MNDTTNNNENGLVQLMTIIAFVLTICLLAWLAIQVVRFIPTAFSSLANVFEANQRALQDRTTGDNDDNVVVVKEDDKEVDDKDITGNDNKVVSTSTVATTTPSTPVVTPAPSKPVATPTPVQYKTVTTYKIPVSDPNGYTDLQVNFIAVGKINSSERFIATTELERREVGAMQFSVKNIGTKTSTSWEFIAELPNGGTMTSKVQQPLKPSETATLTITFNNEDRRGNSTLGATVVGGGDKNLVNNGFRTTVQVR